MWWQWVELVQEGAEEWLGAKKVNRSFPNNPNSPKDVS
jgi:hypothetical protein